MYVYIIILTVRHHIDLTGRGRLTKLLLIERLLVNGYHLYITIMIFNAGSSLSYLKFDAITFNLRNNDVYP